MSAQSGKWREDQVLIVCPGSHTTMAQLGCSDLTPPAHRIPTRIFYDGDNYRPHYTYRRRKEGAPAGSDPARNPDDWEWVEDPSDLRQAIYPIQAGRIINMEAFLAYLDYVHGLLANNPHNTPIVLMASPQWTRADCESIAQFLFEKIKAPALCMINSGVATQYGLKWPNLTIVDIGYEKVDVTCVYDSRVVSHRDLGTYGDPTDDSRQNGAQEKADRREVSGGEVFTRRLLDLLETQGFNKDMAETLKKSPVCEVLPYAPEAPELMNLPIEEGDDQEARAGEPNEMFVAGIGNGTAAALSAPKLSVEEDSLDERKLDEEDEGVLDVANIVASGQTREFLAKKEKEKAEKVKLGRKGKERELDAQKLVKLPNSQRLRNTFQYDDTVEEEVLVGRRPKRMTEKPAQRGEGAQGEQQIESTTFTEVMQGTTEVSRQEEKQEASQSVIVVDETAVAPSTAREGSVDGDVMMPEADIKDTTSEKKPAAEAAASTAGAPDEKEPTATNEHDTKPEPTARETGENTNYPSAAPATVQSTGEEEGDADDSDEAEEEEEEEEDDDEEFEEVIYEATFQGEIEGGHEDAERRRQIRRIQRNIEVGLERFLFADRFEIDRIVTTIYHAVQSIEDMYMRPSCWENIVFVGNGARLRGLRENIMQTLQARHIISPSTATMFTSELPSNLGTPSGTGSQTPIGGQPAPSSSVNPLLQAATTAASLGLPGSEGGHGHGHGHHFHSQTPTQIKLAPLPTYLGEWTKNGFEEAMFLGAQVAARLAFCIHNLDVATMENLKLMSFNRMDYNELGPRGVRAHSMLGGVI